MKTTKEIKQEINSIENDWQDSLMPKRVAKHLYILRQCLMYLDTNPNEQFVQKQYDLVRERIQNAKDRFSEWMQNTPEAKKVKNPKALYDNEMNMPELRLQYKTLNYLLSDIVKVS